MPISLSDVPAAVADYLNHNVKVEVSKVTYGTSTVLQPHEKGTFHVTVTNNGAVRLTELIYELSVSPESVARFISPESLAVFALDGIGGKRISNGAEVDKMFVTGIPDVSWTSVDAGASVTTNDLEVKIQGNPGHATIECTLYATVDEASLFPAGQKGSTTTRNLTVSQ